MGTTYCADLVYCPCFIQLMTVRPQRLEVLVAREMPKMKAVYRKTDATAVWIYCVVPVSLS